MIAEGSKEIKEKGDGKEVKDVDEKELHDRVRNKQRETWSFICILFPGLQRCFSFEFMPVTPGEDWAK
jgi:hypothetical protein